MAQSPERDPDRDTATDKPEPVPITDEYVAELEQAAKAWDDPAVQRMVREMERRRKQIQRKGEQE